MGEDKPEQVTDEDKRTKVFDWKVPLRVGDAAGRAGRHAVLDAAPGWRRATAWSHPRPGRPGRHRAGCGSSSSGAGAPQQARRKAAKPGDRSRALALAFALLALVPASAFAHATLEETTPQRGAQLDAAARGGSAALQRAGRSRVRCRAGLRCKRGAGTGGRRVPPWRRLQEGRGRAAGRSERGLHGYLPGDLGGLAPHFERVRVHGGRRSGAGGHGR